MSAPNWYDIIDATWPAAAFHKLGDWTIREGQGGGKRVSAASGSGDIAQAEVKLSALGQTHLFMIRDGDDALDGELNARGYQIIDPVVIYVKSLPSPRPDTGPDVSPSTASVQIWDHGGIGAARRAVMSRAKGPKTVIQIDGGCAFVACHDGIAMIHALEVDANRRGQGIGTQNEHLAQAWAPARKMAALTVETNKASRALFEKAGYCVVGRYHYRIKP